MSLGNSALWGNVLPGGPLTDVQAGNLDSTQVVDELLPALHAASRADLTFWVEGDIINWMDECLKRLARLACVFAGREQSTLTVPGQANYTQPPQHISTLHVSVDGFPLRPANTLEMEARDDGFRTTPCISPNPPTDWYEDMVGVDAIAFAPVPADELPLARIYEGWPPTLDAGGQQTLVAAPGPLKGYLTFAVLGEAYGKEGMAEAPEIAAHCKGRAAMYEALFTQYYGAGT